MKVLAIAAHPDDEVLGVGGTLLRHETQGDDVRIIVVYKCRGIQPPKGLWMQEPNGEPIPQHWFESCIHQYAPDIVYTHFAGDINADHRAVSEAVRVACRPYAAPSVKRLAEFYTPSSTEWGEAFKPNLYVDITDVFDAKLEALKPYQSEMRDYPHPRSSIGVLNVSAFYGNQAGYEHAEPFVIVRDRW